MKCAVAQRATAGKLDGSSPKDKICLHLSTTATPREAVGVANLNEKT